MNVEIEKGWREALANEFSKPYFQMLTNFVKKEYKENGPIYPPAKLIFNAFDNCSFENTKVVILGQDPYHGPNQANGLSFSVSPQTPTPPSLVNIYKEIENDLSIKPRANGDLTDWAKQGVLLLNATLTVRAHTPGSHQNKGWEEFTDAAIMALNEQKEHIVFILWGSYAQKKGAFINRKKHLVLTSPHPSPLSSYRGFFGNNHFSKTNKYLADHNIQPIAW